MSFEEVDACNCSCHTDDRSPTQTCTVKISKLLSGTNWIATLLNEHWSSIKCTTVATWNGFGIWSGALVLRLCLCSLNRSIGGADLSLLWQILPHCTLYFLCRMREAHHTKSYPHLIEILRYKRISLQCKLTGSVHQISG